MTENIKNMLTEFFVTSALPEGGGYTWTITTRLGQILHEAEKRYGQRNNDWTILGVEFVLDGPRIWFPELARKHVAVQLSVGALDDWSIACYQLAHECIHLLSPNPDHPSTVLEEGVATVFSEEYVNEQFGRLIRSELPSYTNAATLVRELLYCDHDAIKKLRETEPEFGSITIDTFEKVGLEVPQERIDQLLRSFER